MKTGRVLTAVMDIEPRQHDIAGLDLGEGPTRRALIFGALALVVWCLLMAPLVGVPNRYSFSIYFLPPMLITVLGIRPSTRMVRRLALTDWALSARYALLGHRTIVLTGRRRPSRQELPPARERWRILTKAWGRVVPATVRPEWAQAQLEAGPTHQLPTGKPITVRQRARVIGGDAMYELTLQNRHRRKRR